MPMSQSDVIELTAKKLLPEFQAEKIRLDEIDFWLRPRNERLNGHQETQYQIRIPPGATLELRALMELATTPWLPLIVTTTAQALAIDDFRSPDSNDSLPSWRLWQLNDLDGRQGAIWRAALGYGRAYGKALNGKHPMTGEAMPVMRGLSPRKMLAFYQDPSADDWPMYTIEVEPNGLYQTVKVLDDEVEYTMTTEGGGTSGLKFVTMEEHTAEVCPVVQFTNMLDLDGRSVGEIEPFISLARRIDKTTYDRLLIQHYNSWKVRTVSGMAAPDDEEAANQEKLRLRQDDILIAEDPDTKFGTLAETQLDGMIKAREADLSDLGAASQTPTFALTGDLVNISVDTLAAARAAHDGKVEERQDSFGASADRWLKLASKLDGDLTSASDPMGHVSWKDNSIRSMASAVTALGIAATQLGVPEQALWPLIPGITRTTVEEWAAMAKDQDPLSRAMQLAGQPPAPVPA